MEGDLHTEWLSPKPLPPGTDEERFTDQIEQSLRSDRAEEALTNLVYRWFDEGLDEAQSLGILSRYQECLEEAGRDADVEPVIDVISYLIGWCGPEGRIYRRST